MVNFDDWFKDLCSNYVWYEPAKMKHKPETFKAIANAVYMQYVGAEKFPSIQDARVHVYRKVVLTPGDLPKVDWVKVAKKELDEKEAAKKPEWIPLTGEERQAKLKEWEDSLKDVQMISAVPKLTAREIIEQGDWRVVPKLERSDIEKTMVFEDHKQKIEIARRKMFTSYFPDASEEEVQAYINKFDKI